MTNEITAPEVPEVSAPEVKAPVYSAAEERALAKGWKPVDQFHGDPEDHLPAEVFLQNFTWVKEINKWKGANNRLQQDMAKQQQALDYLVEHNQKVAKLSYDQAMQDARKQMEDAAALGDTQTVGQMHDRILELKAQESKPAPLPASGTPAAPAYVQNFIDRNSDWYGPNAAMTAYALSRDKQIAAENPGVDPNVALRMLETDIRKRFADYFEPAAPVARASAHASAESGTAKTSSSKKFGLQDLPVYAQTQAAYLKTSVKNFDVAKFIEQHMAIAQLSS